MLVIRLFRVGKKKQPSFKIVVTDKRRPPRAGRFKEQVGFYSPLTKEKVLKAERIKYWLSVGAKPSDTVYNLLVAEKIITGEKIPSHKISKKKKETTEKSAEQVPPKETVEVKPLKEEKSTEVEEKPKEKEEKKEEVKEESKKENSGEKVKTEEN